MCCGVPMKETAFLLSTPLGRRWKSYSTESTTTVCPALLPPCRHDTQSGGLVEVVFSWFHTTLWAAGRDNSPSMMTLAMSRYYITLFWLVLCFGGIQSHSFWPVNMLTWGRKSQLVNNSRLVASHTSPNSPGAVITAWRSLAPLGTRFAS